MNQMPVLKSERLLLRPFKKSDADDVQKLAGNKDVAKTTINIPYPYEDGMAEEWMSSHEKEYKNGNSLTLAITHKKRKYLIGAISLSIQQKFNRAEMGYWIGKKYWNNGYCTEAAFKMTAFGFEKLELHKIYATHIKENPSSGKVMQKIGMKKEGLLREHVIKWGEYKDLIQYGILKREFKY